jgi:hypothetical protein
MNMAWGNGAAVYFTAFWASLLSLQLKRETLSPLVCLQPAFYFF